MGNEKERISVLEIKVEVIERTMLSLDKRMGQIRNAMYAMAATMLTQVPVVDLTEKATKIIQILSRLI